MKRRLPTVVALAMVLVQVLSLCSKSKAAVQSHVSADTVATREIRWYAFAEGIAKAQAEQKPIVMDVYTEWCGWCKVMDSKTYGNDTVQTAMNGNCIAIKFNPEVSDTVTFQGKRYSGEELTQFFGIDGYPATVLMKPNGDKISLLSGYIVVEKFLGVLDYVQTKKYEQSSMTMEEYLVRSAVERNPENVQARIALGHYFHGPEHFEESIQEFRKALQYKPTDAQQFEIYYSIAEIYLFHQTNLTEAEKNLRLALPFASETDWKVRTNMFLGYVLSQQKKNKEAFRFIEKAILAAKKDEEFNIGHLRRIIKEGRELEDLRRQPGFNKMVAKAFASN